MTSQIVTKSKRRWVELPIHPPHHVRGCGGHTAQEPLGNGLIPPKTGRDGGAWSLFYLAPISVGQEADKQ